MPRPLASLVALNVTPRVIHSAVYSQCETANNLQGLPGALNTSDIVLINFWEELLLLKISNEKNIPIHWKQILNCAWNPLK